jgi:flagellar M-ring protein FliF
VSVALNRGTVTGVDAEQVEALVATAAGIDPERGDSVVVEFVEFSDSGATAAQAALAQADAERRAQFEQELLRAGIIGGSILLAAAAIVIAIVVRRRRRRRMLLTEEGPIEYLATMTATEEDRLKAIKGWKEPVAVAPIPPRSPAPEFLDIEEEPEADQVLVERRRREIDEIAKADPDAIASALASMMDEATV